jgi:hypothetical protein
MEHNPAEDFLPAEAKGIPQESPNTVVMLEDLSRYTDEPFNGRPPLPQIESRSAIESVYDAPGLRISKGQVVGPLAPGVGRSGGAKNFRNAEEFRAHAFPDFNCSCGGNTEYINPKTVRCVRCGQKYARKD